VLRPGSVKRRISFFVVKGLLIPATRFFVAEPKVLSVAEALLRITEFALSPVLLIQSPLKGF
jgi:hypothetical protein